jgi:hypothetical protein
MIARHESNVDKGDIWAQLSAPLPADTISWRQDGRAVPRDGKFFARFVAYVDANTVRERLDAVVPGEWDLTLELLPTLASDDPEESNCSFKARLQILGVIREDVGTGRDYKSAATDAFKRAAVRYGVAHELYAYEQNWVRVDGDGKYAKPLEDPAESYARRLARTCGGELAIGREEADESNATTAATGPLASDEPTCPKCGGRMWDNRSSKRNPKAPDYKCRSRSCDGVIWPTRAASSADAAEPVEQPVLEYSIDTTEIPF